MEHKNDKNHFQKHGHDTGHLSAHRNIQKNTEDMERKQRDNDRFDEARNDVAEVDEDAVQRIARHHGQPQPDDEREKERRHNVHERRHGNDKIRSEHQGFGILHNRQLGVGSQEHRKNGRCAEIGEEAGKNRRPVSNKCGDEQQPPRSFPDLADSRRYKPENNQRNRK